VKPEIETSAGSGSSIYADVAEMVAASEDPRAEILEIARMASARARRRRAVVTCSAVAAVLAVGFGAWAAWPTSANEPTQVAADHRREVPAALLSPEAARAWLREIISRPRPSTLTAAETDGVRGLLIHSSTIVRRGALRVLADHDVLLREDELAWFLANPHPDTDSQALRLAWRQCHAQGEWRACELLETFVMRAEMNLRKYAVRALGEVESYLPSEAVLELIRASDGPTRDAARKLLARARRR
jgi:hypothetical protein